VLITVLRLIRQLPFERAAAAAVFIRHSMLLLLCLLIASHLLSRVVSESITTPEPVRIPVR
jgi:hypothetical protein